MNFDIDDGLRDLKRHSKCLKENYGLLLIYKNDQQLVKSLIKKKLNSTIYVHVKHILHEQGLVSNSNITTSPVVQI